VPNLATRGRKFRLALYDVVSINDTRPYNFPVRSRGSAKERERERERGSVDIDRDPALFPVPRTSTSPCAGVPFAKNSGYGDTVSLIFARNAPIAYFIR